MLYITGKIDLFGCKPTSELLKLNDQGKDYATNFQSIITQKQQLLKIVHDNQYTVYE
jgi:hypothetical protein